MAAWVIIVLSRLSNRTSIFSFIFSLKTQDFFWLSMNYLTLYHQSDNFLLFLLVLIAPAVIFFFFLTLVTYVLHGNYFNRLEDRLISSLVFFINVLLKEVPLKTEIKKSIIFEIQIWIKQFLWQEYSIYGKKYNLKNNPCPVTWQSIRHYVI